MEHVEGRQSVLAALRARRRRFQVILIAQQQEIMQQAQLAIQQALRDQAPLAGVDAGFRGGRWRQSA